MRQRALRMIRRKIAPSRGVLRTATADSTRTRHVRYHPSAALAPWVEHYWSVEWDYGGAAPERVEILPHPSVHLIFQRGVGAGARVMGVARGKVTRVLRGTGGIFAVKFTPGGFYPLLRAPISTLTDSIANVRDVLGSEGVALARAVLAARTDPARAMIVERFLGQRLAHENSDDVVRFAGLVYSVVNDRTILKVEDLVARSGEKRRTLERRFAKYVGVSPKWVIQRYRLHEAAEQLASANGVSQVALALRLGYSDQAHFVRDFKAVVGKSPAAYTRMAALARR
ncbi:MAG TPA: helix-turn-helix domain-containing protein [Gemmatimonadaceae bacterium]|nr:helix-turn-helix domain-containing protein [Gemmatimonadaceae bacterium]